MQRITGKGRLCRFAAACLMVLCLFAPALPSAAEEEEDEIPFLYAFGVDEVIRGMTLHEKVCQLFIVAPEQICRLPRVSSADEEFLQALERWPVGGIILFNKNIEKDGIKELTAAMKKTSLENGIGLFIGVDEEGGSVSRLAYKLSLPERQPAAGSDPQDVADKGVRFVDAMHEYRIIPVLKHFPGHGAVSGDTHAGAGISRRTPDDWRLAEFIPFEAGIGADAEMVLLSHQIVLSLDRETPASLSPEVVSILRDELGFEGVVVTDALRMKAVHEKYGSREACVLALEAGADMLLLPYNFTNAYEAVMEAVESGRLTEDRIDESLRRILLLKVSYGLLPAVSNP